MKKNLLLIIAVLLGSIGMVAQPRSEGQAKQIASEFFKKKPQRKAPMLSVVSQQKVSQTIRKKVSRAKSAPAQHSACYIINDEANNRFVIVSADERLYEILGYSSNGCFDAEKAPDGLLDMISGYDSEYDYVLASGIEAKASPKRNNVEAIDPLIPSAWHQSNPYNLQCPLSSNGQTLSVTGCVATAMAQVMNKWKYPQKGQGGLISYTTESTNTPQFMNYDTLRIDWSKITNIYNSSSSAVQKNEVAKLMHACGISVFMDYDTGSGAKSEDIPYALINQFGFNSNVFYLKKYYHSDKEWNELIMTELKNNRPILYSGIDLSQWAGHQFILDGVDNNGLYHFNYGWTNSNGDGYYSLNAINPSIYNFTVGQDMVIHICPESIGVHKDVFYFDDFEMKPTANINEIIDMKLSFGCYSNQTNSQKKWFEGSVGFGVFDKDWNFVKSLLEVNVERLRNSNNERKYVFAGTRLSVSGSAIRIKFDNSLFGDEGKQWYIAPYVVNDKGNCTRGKTYRGEKDWYRATTQNGKVILEPITLIDIPPIYEDTIPDGLVGTFDVTALDDINQKTAAWQVVVTKDEIDSTKYWFHNIDKMMLEKGYSTATGTNRVFGFMKKDGKIRIPAFQSVGGDYWIKNYLSTTDSILVEISRVDSVMDIEKSVWGICDKSTGETLSRYTNTHFAYPNPQPVDTIATPIINVDEQQRMTISCTTEDVVIRYTYTKDGEEPTEESTLYDGVVTLWKNGVVKAVAFKGNKTSSVATISVNSFTVTKPVIAENGNTITITCETQPSTIYYTIDGSLPSVKDGRVGNGTKYNGEFECDVTTLIQAIAVRSDWNNSRIDSLYHIIPVPVELDIANNIAGELPYRISQDRKQTVQSLRITGQLNGTDIKFIREMIIEGKLAYLNMEGAFIVEGGDEYYVPSIGSGEKTSDNVIGHHMFDNCKGLIDLKLPQSIVAIDSWVFMNCDGLKELVIPESCQKVEDYAIYSAKNLETVCLSSNMQEFGGNNFNGCPNFKSFSVAEGNAYFKAVDGVLYKDNNTLVKYPRAKEASSFVIPSGIETIGAYAFEYAKFENITIPENLISIEEHAFSNCTNLIEMRMPNSVEKVERWAFSNCKNLISATMSSNVTELSSNLFYHCTNLQKLIIGSNVTKIDHSSFEGCSSLQEFSVAEGNSNYASIGGILYSNDLKKLKRCPLALYSDNLVLPEGLEEIEEDAFNDCKNLHVVQMPTSLKHIGRSAFNGSSITAVRSIENVENIDNWAFAGTKELETFVMPENVNIVNGYTFYNSEHLRYIYLPAKIREFGDDAFYGCKTLTYINSRIKEVESIKVGYSSSLGAYTSFSGIPSDCTWRVPSGPETDIDKYARRYMAQPWWVSTWQIIIDEEPESTSQTITFANNSMRTFCSDNTLDFTNVEGLSAYIASGFSAETGEVLMSKVGKVPAKTGLLLVSEPNKHYEVPYTETGFIYSNLLEGVTETTNITNGYVLEGVSFKTVLGSQTVNEGEAYLNIPSTIGKNQLKIKFIDTTDIITDVEDLKTEAKDMTGWYTLQGTRLTHKPTQSGIYLHQGKKVTVK